MTHIIQPLRPPLEGMQHRALWCCGRRNQEPGFVVPTLPVKADAHQATHKAVSARIPNYALNDASVMRIEATGTYRAGSPDPRMYFDLALGPKGSETALRPTAGYIRSDLTSITLPDNGIEVSYNTVGENALGWEPDEELDWHLSLTVHLTGHDGIGKLEDSARPNQSIRVTGSVRWGKLLELNGMGATTPGPFLIGRNQQWGPLYPATMAKGHQVSNHGHGYRAIADIPAVIDSSLDEAASLAAFQANRNAALDNQFQYEPGAARFWRRYWYKLQQELPVDFTANVDLEGQDMMLHLRLGGPFVMDPATVIPAHSTGGGNYQAWPNPVAAPSQPEFIGTALEGGVAYVTRFDHSKSTSPLPGGAAGTESDRTWRRLADDRADHMVMHSSVATLIGGRIGVGDSPRGS